MKTCKKCGKKFPNQIRLEGKNFTLHKRTYCLDCSPIGSRKFCGPCPSELSTRDLRDSEIIKYAAESSSMAQLLRKLNLKPAGGNYAQMKRHIQRLEIDCSHWKGMLWNKGDRLKDWSDYSRAVALKPHLIKIRGHRCQSCKLDRWLEEIIPLEIHHIDGDRTNNQETNLSLLCCNCHAQTDNWRNKKRMVRRVGFEPTL